MGMESEDAHDPDDDNDGYSDAEEIAYGSDPRDVNSLANTAPQIAAQSFRSTRFKWSISYGYFASTPSFNVSAIDADGDDLNYSIYGWQDLQHFEINTPTEEV